MSFDEVCLWLCMLQGFLKVSQGDMWAQWLVQSNRGLLGSRQGFPQTWLRQPTCHKVTVGPTGGPIQPGIAWVSSRVPSSMVTETGAGAHTDASMTTSYGCRNLDTLKHAVYAIDSYHACLPPRSRWPRTAPWPCGPWEVQSSRGLLGTAGLSRSLSVPGPRARGRSNPPGDFVGPQGRIATGAGDGVHSSCDVTIVVVG